MNTSLLGGITVLTRVLGMGILIYVLREQLRITQIASKLRGLKWLLFYLVLFMILQNILPIYNNYLRLTHGSQNELINNITFVTGGIGFLVTAVLLLLIYKFKVKE